VLITVFDKENPEKILPPIVAHILTLLTYIVYANENLFFF